jgi:hypothetical protein
MSLSSAPLEQPPLSLEDYVRSQQESIREHQREFVGRLLSGLLPIHRVGTAHGGICPEAFRFAGGDLDRQHFVSFQGGPVDTLNPIPKEFVAPEVRSGQEQDRAADCYSLGAVFFSILTHQTPSENPEDMQATLSALQVQDEWDPPIIEAVKRCLSADKSARLASAEEFLSFIGSGVKEGTTATDTGASKSAPSEGVSHSLPGVRWNRRLPNASVGKPYEQNIRALCGDGADQVAVTEVSVPVETGLRYDEAAEAVRGTPSLAGEFELEIRFTLSAAPHEASTRTMFLIINPDPTALWRDEPSDKSGRFAKDDKQSESILTPDLIMLAASIRGRSHAHEGKYRDDHFAIRFIGETGWQVMIVADGAGSAQFSREGSRICCERSVGFLANKLGGPNDLDAALHKLGESERPEDLEKLRKISYNVFVGAAYDSLAAIRATAEQQGAKLRDFATTYIAVITKRVQQRWFVAAFSIGDGGAGVLESAEALTLLMQPDSGDFAGQTMFLTMSNIFNDTEGLLARTHASFIREFKFIGVMTDGITDPIFKNDTNLSSAAQWAEWSRQLTEVVNFEDPREEMKDALLAWLNFASPGNHDDRTLILVVPRPMAFQSRPSFLQRAINAFR